MTASEHPDWLLERILLNEVPPHLEVRARAALADPSAQARLEELRQEDVAFRRTHATESALAEIHRVATSQERAEAIRPRLRKAWWGAAIPLASLALVIAVFPRHQEEKASAIASSAQESFPRAPGSVTSATTTPADLETPAATRQQSVAEPSPSTASVPAEGIRSKGDPVSLAIHRRDASGTIRLRGGDSLHAGDELQLSLEAHATSYVCIVSLDAAGNVTPHLPEASGDAVHLEAGQHLSLPHSYELDASPGFERFWVISSAAPFRTADILKQLTRLPAASRAQGHLELADAFSQSSQTFPKARP